MPLDATATTRGDAVIITLVGELDGATASILQDQVDLAVTGNARQLVLEMSDMTYLSSAGLRQLVYARQRMADGVRVILVGANDRVRHTIKLVGFDQSVTFTDRIPE